MSFDRIDVVGVPGAGSSGMTWRPVLDLIDMRVLPVPDASTVEAMADELAGHCMDPRRPRLVVAASLGEMVALELTKRVRVDALVLAAAGPGITVAPSLLDWLVNGVDVLAKVAASSLWNPDDLPAYELAVADLESRGREQLCRHLSVLSEYRLETVPTVPTVIVAWGVHDRAVPLGDHVELATRLGGLLAPVQNAAHLPFLEEPAAFVAQVRRALLLMDGASDEGG